MIRSLLKEFEAIADELENVPPGIWRLLDTSVTKTD
jgi:hypothetical protein